MAAWLYPISERAGRRLGLKDGRTWLISVDTYRTAVERRLLAERDDWYITTNFHNVRQHDDVYIYTGDQDLGIIGYARVNKVVQDDDLEKCSSLLKDPVPAKLLRRLVAPRAAVVNLTPHARRLKRFLHLTRKRISPNKETTVSSTGGSGFGRDKERNRRVELAAVRAVIAYYSSKGWDVDPDYQKKGQGFDLLCQRGSEIKLVEVKGVSGNKVSFPITAGEVRASDRLNFVLHVVLRALSKEPKILRWSGKQMKKDFDLTAIQYFATLKS